MAIYAIYVTKKLAQASDKLTKMANQIGERGNLLSDQSLRLTATPYKPKTRDSEDGQSFSVFKDQKKHQFKTLHLKLNIKKEVGRIDWIGILEVSNEKKIFCKDMKNVEIIRSDDNYFMETDVYLVNQSEKQDRVVSWIYIMLIDSTDKIHFMLVQFVTNVVIGIDENERMKADTDFSKSPQYEYVRCFFEYQLLAYDNLNNKIDGWSRLERSGNTENYIEAPELSDYFRDLLPYEKVYDDILTIKKHLQSIIG